MVLGSGMISLDALRGGSLADAGGVNPRVLEDLRRVLLVVPSHFAAADTLRCHKSVWEWVSTLSSAGDQHELAFIFVLPPEASSADEGGLALGLSVDFISPLSTGHAVWRQSGSLDELLALLNQTRPMDLLPLKARRAADAKRNALAQLRAASLQDDPSLAVRAAKTVLDVFAGMEHSLDIYCCPPSHQHGNHLRTWLRALVTGNVTPQQWMSTKQQFNDWVAGSAQRET